MESTRIEGVRNVGVYGHSGAGKTMLIEHILHIAGEIPRMGSIEQGNSVGDYLAEEIAHKHTVCMKFMHFDWHGVRVHIVDHPGYMDFVGEVAASMPLIDGAILVVDASTGIQVGTDKAMEYADRYRVPRAIFVNKLDRENTDYDATVADIRATYGKKCVPLVIPVGRGSGLEACVNILDDDCSGLEERIAGIKEEVADAVAESDEGLLAKYLETGVLTPDEFHAGLHAGIRAGTIVPIIAGSVEKNVGMRRLMDVVADSFPRPDEREVIAMQGDDAVQLVVGADEPFVGQVLRTYVDPFVGQLTVFRVLTGTLQSDSEFIDVDHGVKERTGKIFLLDGREQLVVDKVGPGDIAAMTKLKDTHFGDTIAAPGVTVKMPEIELPESLVKLAIVPRTRADEDRIGDALNRLSEEEPTFHHYRDETTKEHVILGVGDLQLKFLLERLHGKYNVDVDTRLPKVAHKESIRGTVEVQGKHKKQSGGHGQYGDVHLRISPNERGAGYRFIDSIVGGVVPRNFIAHVDKGCQDRLEQGVLAGFPVVDVTVELFDGSYHNVDSSELAFKLAAHKAIQDGVMKAQPYLLEPIVELEVVAPDGYMGDITGDLSSRRARVLGMEPVGGGRQRITAHIPESEVLQYSADLRSITSGQGRFSFHFDHYEEMPASEAKAVIAEA